MFRSSISTMLILGPLSLFSSVVLAGDGLTFDFPETLTLAGLYGSQISVEIADLVHNNEIDTNAQDYDKPQSIPALNIRYPTNDTVKALAIDPNVYQWQNSSLGWSISDCLVMVGVDEQLCAFTATRFGNGRGMSIIGTIKGVSEVAKKLEFIHQSGADQVVDDTESLVKEEWFPGKNRGWVATQTIPAGSLINSDYPVMMLDNQVRSEFTEHKDYNVLLSHAVESLPKKGRELFMEQHGQFGGNPYQDRINTNAFDVGGWVLDGDAWKDSYTGVIPETARMNHDCRPNTQYSFDWKTFKHSTYAVRTIHAGEEVTDTYVYPTETHEERAGHLMRGWGFKCGCNACRKPKALIQASDDRIIEIQNIKDQLADRSRPMKDGRELVQLLITLHEQERHFGPIAHAYALAAYEHNGMGDHVAARKWAYKAKGALGAYVGIHDEEVRALQELLDEPRSHWSWNFRMDAYTR